MALIYFCFTSFQVFAFTRDDDPDVESETKVKIAVELECDENFKESLDIYFNEAPLCRLYHDTAKENNGYIGPAYLEPGTYEVVVLSSTDIAGKYIYEYPKTFNTNDGTLNIKAISNPEYEKEVRERELNEHKAHDNMVYEEPSEVEPAIFDFSNNEPSGRIHIKANYEAAILSARYTLVGENKVYEIDLTRDNLFLADVILPVGSYYESTSISVKLDPDAVVTDDTNYLWVHENNTDFFGNYYEVTENGEIEINDISVYLITNGEKTKATSNILFSSKMVNNRAEAQEKFIESQLESAFGTSIEES